MFQEMSVDATDLLDFVVEETNNPQETSHGSCSSSTKVSGEVTVPLLLDANKVEEYLRLIEGTAAAVSPAASYENQCLTRLAGCERGLEDIWNLEEPSVAAERGSEWDVEVSKTSEDQQYYKEQLSNEDLCQMDDKRPDAEDKNDSDTCQWVKDTESLAKHSTSKRQRRCLKLWHWFLWLLVNSLHRDVIRWEDEREGVFVIEKPKEIAKMWGKAKNPQKPNTSYEHMARAMRYYYKPGIMASVPGRRLVYRFCANADMWKKSLEGAPVVLQGKLRSI